MAMAGPLPGDLFYVDYSSNLDPAVVQKYTVSIISPDADLSRINLGQPGKKIYGYLSIGEVAPDAPYLNDVMRQEFDVQHKNKNWGSFIMDVSDARWQSYVVDNLALEISKKGFSGFFLDTIDSHQILAKGSKARKEELSKGVIKIIKRLKARYPDKEILINRGFDIWKDVKTDISGILAESLFQTYDFISDEYKPTSRNDREWLLSRLREIQSEDIPIYIIDYALPEKRDSIRDLYKRYESLGFHLCISNVELNGVVVHPESDEPRNVFTIYGRDAGDPSKNIYWSVDSATAATLQTPGEYLGLEFFYHNVGTDGVPMPLTSKFSAVIVDNNLEIPKEIEQGVLNWLIEEKRNGRKIIIWGKLPFTLSSVRNQFMREFGIHGSGDFVPVTAKVEIAHQSSDFNFEFKTIPTNSDFMDIRAPSGSDISLILKSKLEAGQPIEFHPAFYADWGAFVFLNEAIFRIGGEMRSWCINPFLFLTKALDIPNWPIPDVSTQNGLRIFYSHIDGDGFRNLSTVSPGMRSSEIIYEKIIKKYPYPVTASVIESEVRAQIEGQDPGEADDLIRIARTIFNSSKVEAASHTYSHPFYWKVEDKITGGFADNTQILKLKNSVGYRTLDIEKEINDPIDFIENFLLPDGKKVEIVLWSGNCRIPKEALAMTRALGLRNMNGGLTIMSRSNPSILKVAPKCRETFGELQIHNAVQNENVFRKMWKKNGVDETPFYGGFENVLSTFKYTEKPRRLKPVNVYYHWYSGDNWASVKAIESVMEWCRKQELSITTAANYSKIVEDSRDVKIYRQGNNAWRITNGGFCRTFRFEEGEHVPDIGSSDNVIGYNFVNGKLYVTTGSKTETIIRLTTKPSQHVYLQKSTGIVDVTELSPRRIGIKVKSFEENKVKTGGWLPGREVDIQVNSDVTTALVGADGTLELLLPSDATVTIQQ